MLTINLEVGFIPLKLTYTIIPLYVYVPQREHRQLLNQSTWDNLKILSKSNNNVLRVLDAVSFLVEMKMFNDREHARNVIYSTLYSHRKDLERMRKGVYRFLSENETKKTVKHIRPKRNRTKTGIHVQ